MSVTPSGVPDATSTNRGLLSALAQAVGGIKTFVALLVASSGVQTISVFGTAGTVSTDRSIKVGTSLSDGSIHALARIFAVFTGIGGTESEKFSIDKFGDFWAGTTTGTGRFRGTSASSGYLAIDDTTGWTLRFGAFQLSGSGSEIYFFDNTLNGRVFNVQSSGAIGFKGTDSTGTPGNRTGVNAINKPAGKSSIASGASSCQIDNSLVTAASHVVITPHARDTTCKELIVVAAAGSFTVSGSANASANLPFSWEVKGLL